jgi:hypothetical protein
MVIGVPPLEPVFVVVSDETTGASYVNVCILVPTTAETVTCGEVRLRIPTLAGSLHTSDVSEFH